MELMSKDLTTTLPGKEGRMISVEYPPGSADPIHRHNAYGFIYVLEGSIVTQVRGGKEVTLTPGQTFEGPEDVHVIGRNASQIKPAKFVVFFRERQRRSDPVPREISQKQAAQTPPRHWPSIRSKPLPTGGRFKPRFGLSGRFVLHVGPVAQPSV
jgi:quercetin dioxygenase-like cupin family protein